MTRTQLEHIIRASAGITGADQFIVIGSQSILGQHPDAPGELRESMEADVFTFRSPDDAGLIDGSIGEESPFHRTFGYYAHGVAAETATLPDGWRDRLVPLRGPGTGNATGMCLEAHDLAVSKLVAGRDKDMEFVRAMIRHGLVHPGELHTRLGRTQLPDVVRQMCEARLGRLGAG